MQVVRGRRQFAVLALVLACAPWFRGGRDAAGLILIGLFLLLGFIAVRTLEPRRFRMSGAGWWYGALLLWGALSWIWSVNRYSTTIWVIIVALAGLAALLSAQVASNEDSRNQLTRGFLELAVIFSLYGFWLFATGDYDRLTSTFYWANPWATFLLPAVMIAWWRYITGGRRLYLAMGVLLLTAFTLTYSRAALVVLVAVSLYLVIRHYHSREHIGRIFLSLFLVVVASFTMIEIRREVSHGSTVGISDRFAEAVAGDSVSGLDRIYYLRSTLAIFLAHPIIGTGVGTFGSEHPQYQYRVISAGSSAHNTYAQLVAELGAVGGVLVLGLMLTLLWGLRRRVIEDPSQLLAVAGLVAALIHLGLDVGSNYPALIIFVGALVGMLYRPNQDIGLWSAPVSYNWVAFGGLFLMAQPIWAAYTSANLALNGADEQSRGEIVGAADTYNEAHLQLTYNPDTLTADGIDRFTLAGMGRDKDLNLDLAINRADAGIHQDPANADNYLLLGRSQWLSGNRQAAEVAYRKGLELDRWNQPLLYSDLANLFLAEQRYAEALELSSEAIALYPRSVIANRNALADLPGEIGDMYAIQGHAWEALGNIPQAIESARNGLETDPANTTVGNMYKRLTGQTSGQAVPQD